MSDQEVPAKTPEQVEAEKAAAKAEKAKVAAEKKEARAKASAEKKELVTKAKADKAAAKLKEKEDKAAAKLAAKESSKQPEQNGVRRPKPDTLCGKAWAIFDSVSQKTGAPATIGESMVIAKASGYNEANVRAEYARWRKFNGVSGRLVTPKPDAPAAEVAAS